MKGLPCTLLATLAFFVSPLACDSGEGDNDDDTTANDDDLSDNDDAQGDDTFSNDDDDVTPTNDDDDIDPLCGNGMLDGVEECDPGLSEAICSSHCLLTERPFEAFRMTLPEHFQGMAIVGDHLCLANDRGIDVVSISNIRQMVEVSHYDHDSERTIFAVGSAGNRLLVSDNYNINVFMVSSEGDLSWYSQTPYGSGGGGVGALASQGSLVAGLYSSGGFLAVQVPELPLQGGTVEDLAPLSEASGVSLDISTLIDGQHILGSYLLIPGGLFYHATVMRLDILPPPDEWTVEKYFLYYSIGAMVNAGGYYWTIRQSGQESTPVEPGLVRFNEIRELERNAATPSVPLPGFGTALTALGDRLYVSEPYLQVINITDPLLPFIEATLRDHAGKWMRTNGSCAFVADDANTLTAICCLPGMDCHSNEDSHEN